jgi:hypothetical protein
MEESIAQLLGTLSEAEDKLRAELERLYPTGTKVRAQVQTNRGPDEVTIVGPLMSDARRLRVRYAGGHVTTVHCGEIVERL